MGDFSRGGGEYMKPMGFDGWFFQGGGGVHKTDGFDGFLDVFYCF